MPDGSGVAALDLESQRLDSLHILSAEIENRVRVFLLCGQEDESAASELAKVVEAFLPAAAEACGNDGALPTPVGVALSRMREVLHLRPVARAAREFIGGLLYLALTRTPCEEDVLTWSTRCKLLTFLHAMCDVQAGPLARGESSRGERACASCACRHIVIQEILSLVRYLQRFGCYPKGSMTESRSPDSVQGQRHLTPFVEDGVVAILGALRQQLKALHPTCCKIAQQLGDAHLSWKSLLVEITRSTVRGAGVAWRPLKVAPIVAQTLCLIQAGFEELERAATPDEASNASPSCSESFASRPEEPFFNFPPHFPSWIEGDH